MICFNWILSGNFFAFCLLRSSCSGSRFFQFFLGLLSYYLLLACFVRVQLLLQALIIGNTWFHNSDYFSDFETFQSLTCLRLFHQVTKSVMTFAYRSDKGIIKYLILGYTDLKHFASFESDCNLSKFKTHIGLAFDCLMARNRKRTNPVSNYMLLETVTYSNR